jgi:hypothetical protein
MDATARSSAEIEHGTNPSERRRHVRIGIMLMATLRSTNGIFDCMVLDLSRGGAKVMLHEPHVIGTAVTLILGGFGSFRAQPVWQRGEIIGIRFADPPETIASAFPGLVP